MSTILPDSQKNDLFELESKRLIQLLEIDIESGTYVFRFSNEEARTAGGLSWERNPFQIAGLKWDSSQEVSRPKLQVANGNGVLTPFVLSGQFEGAVVRRYTYHPDDLAAGLHLSHRWYIEKLVQLNSKAITFELRNPGDRNRAKLPNRRYSPDEGFPSVSLR